MAFPTTELPVLVYLAPGGNPGAPETWVWQDITDQVRFRSGISISCGRGDEAANVDASQCGLTIDNRSGDFTTRNPLGQWYGSLGKNTPLRVSIQRVSDTYSRTAVNSWGSTDTGQAWSPAGVGGTVATSDHQVTGGKGTQSVPTTIAYRHDWLSTVELRDVDVTVTVTLPFTDVTGGSLEPANVLIRMQDASTYYMCRLTIDTAEAVSCSLICEPAGTVLASATTVTGLTHTAAQAIKVRAQITGPVLRMKAWAATGTEPAGWTVQATDTTITAPGGVGIRSGVAAGNTNTKPIVFSYDDLSIEVDRFIGTVPEWPTRWDKGSADCTAPIVAAGILRRLQQGAAPLRSPLYREIIAAGPSAYWPLEEGEAATSAVSPIAGVQPMTAFGFSRFQEPGTLAPIPAAGLPKFGTGGGVAGSADLPDLTQGGTLVAPVPRATGVTLWSVEWVAAFKRDGFTGIESAVMVEWRAEGTYPQFYTTADATSVRVFHANAADMALAAFTGSCVATFNAYDGIGHHYRYDCQQNGANLLAALYVDGQIMDVATNFGPPMVGTMGRVTSMIVNTTESGGDIMPIGIGHVAVYNGAFSTADPSAATGWAGELASDRVQRLCDEEGVAVSVEAGTSEPLGAQQQVTLVEVLRQCADADSGVLSELGGGLRYVPRAARYNRAADLALDFDAGQLAETPEPTDDDQQVRNAVTVERRGGSKATYEDQAHIDANGRYDESVTLDVATDGVLPQHAAWRAHLGTSGELRWPHVDVNLRASPELIDQWLSCRQGSRMTVANPPAQLIGADIDVAIEGWAEYLAPYDWTIAPNCSPIQPWSVAVSDSDTLGKADTMGSVVAEAISASATTVRVATTSGPLWTVDPTELPVDIIVGGERMTVTGIAGHTLSFVAAGTAVHGNNASVTPGLPAGRVAGDLLLMWCAIRNSGTGHPDTPAGWTRIGPAAAADNVRLCARIATNTAADQPLVTFTGGVANADTTAQMIAVRSSAGTFYDPAALVAVGGTILNGSAQNIDYPGATVPADRCLILYLGWKQDNWTSVATIAGATEIGEPSTATGDNQGLVWDYVVQTTAADIASGTFTATGGLAAISRGAVVAIRSDSQTFTVTRSLNGVTKAHAAGADLRLAHPAVAAL